jgi:hypothetical protein
MTRLNAIFLALISTVFAAPVFAGDDRLVRTDRFVTLAGAKGFSCAKCGLPNGSKRRRPFC